MQAMPVGFPAGGFFLLSISKGSLNVGTDRAHMGVAGDLRDPATEIPTPPSDHTPLGGVVRLERSDPHQTTPS